MGCQWPKMGRNMLDGIKPFQVALERCHNALQTQVDFNLLNLIQNGSDNSYDDPLNAFVGICAIQVIMQF